MSRENSDAKLKINASETSILLVDMTLSAAERIAGLRYDCERDQHPEHPAKRNSNFYNVDAHFTTLHIYNSISLLLPA